LRAWYCKSKRGDDTLSEAWIPNEWGREHGFQSQIRVYPFNIMVEALYEPSICDVITICYIHELSHIFEPNMTERQMRRLEKAISKAIDLQRNQILDSHR